MKPLLTLFVLMCCSFLFAQPRDIQSQLDASIALNVGDTAITSGFRITLLHVNDDGCGRVRECYWIAYRDATFEVWQSENNMGEVTLSRASREDSQPWIQIGEFYLILKDALDYETDIQSAEFYITHRLENYLCNAPDYDYVCFTSK
jgi:hypothetical protein